MSRYTGKDLCLVLATEGPMFFAVTRLTVLTNTTGGDSGESV